MKTMTKFILVTIILFMVGLSYTSAVDISDDANSTTTSASISSDISNTHDNISSVSNIQTTTKKTNKTINKQIDNNKTVKKSSHVTTITKKEYDLFFRYNSATNKTESTDLVQSGDILDLQGTFSNVNFTVDKKNITLTSIGKTAKLYNCTVNVQGIDSTGSVIENLTITNNNYFGSGIYVNITKNIVIANNTIHVWGPFAFALASDQMNNSLIIDNYFETSCREDTNRTHTAVAFGLCYYNNIVNNTVVSDQANGIYFSVYGSGLFQGGYCDYNNITGNDVTGGDTSWSYTIQVMGTQNYIRDNNVRGGYRGISTQDFTNNYIIGNEVNGTAQGIYACEGAIVTNNIVHVNGTTTGIETGGDGVIVVNNTVTSNSGYCLKIGGSNTNISSNYLWSTLGNGIYSKGKYTNINLDNNTIISGKTGILFKKQSSSKKINYVNVTRNKIQSYGEYAIDFSEAGAKSAADTHIYVAESNVLNSTSGQGMNAYNPPSNGTNETTPDSNKTYIVTENNYYSYFTDENILNTNKVLKNDTIILKGSFTNKDFTLPIKVHMVGQNCTIHDGTITFTTDADASTLTNVTILNNDKNTINKHGIEIIEVNNCKITNVSVNNYDRWESFGIFVYSSSGNQIINNTIFTSGDYVNYAIMVYASDMNNITKNNVHLNQSNVPIEYDDSIMFDERIGEIKEVLHNYGIVLIYSSYNIMDQNNIKVTSQFTKYQFPSEECKNSVVGLDVYYDSNYNSITNNIINVNSYGPYEYGMGVLGAPWGSSITSLNATNNTFRNNKVTVNGGYFATGFIAGLNSVNTIVDNNIFVVNALHNSTQKGDYAYGLTLEHCLKTKYTNNILNATAASLYSVELFDTTDNIIENNTVYGEATHPYGIAGYRARNNIIYNNNITMKEMNYGNTSLAMHTDAIPFGNNAIMLMSNSMANNITYNTINTNASEYAVNLTVQAINNTVCENSINSTKYIGDLAVLNGHKTNKVSNNFLYFTDIIVHPAQGTVGIPITLKSTVTSAGNLNNLTVTYRLATTVLGITNVNKDGTAQIVVNKTSFLKPTIYTIIASVSGTNFQNSTGTAVLNLNKTMDQSIVNVEKVNAIAGNNVTFKANITDSYNSQLTGNATFVLEGKTLATVSINLGKASYTYKIPANTKSGIYNITVIYSGNSDYRASEGSNILGVQTKTITTVSSATGTIGNTVNITAKFTANGNAISTGNASITINNKKIATCKISNGIIKYSYLIPTSTTAGKYTTQVTYTGNDTLASSTSTNTLTVNKMPTLLSYNTTRGVIGDNMKIIVSVSNTSKGYYSNSGNMTISINGETIKYTNGSAVVGYVNSNGSAIFTFTAPSTLLGGNNISFTYGGNNQFYGATTNFTNGLIIYSKDCITNIITKNITGQLGNYVYLVATAKLSNGTLISNGKVAVKINGVTDGYTNITNGKISYKLLLTTSNFGKYNYKVTYVYGGTNIYTPAQSNAILTVRGYNSTIKAKVTNVTYIGDIGILTVHITNASGYSAKSGSIGLKINGVTYKVNGSAVTSKVSNGVAIIKFNTTKNMVGKNNITVTYSGNSQFYKGKTTFTNIFNVQNKTRVICSVDKTTTALGQSVVLRAKFTTTSGVLVTSGKVAVKINGVTKYHANITNGVATYTFYANPVDYGGYNHKITFTYGGSNSYSDASANGILTITKYTPKFTYTKVTTTVGSKAKISVKISNVKNTYYAQSGSVGIKINGVTYKINGVAYTVKPVNGIASFNIPITTSMKGNNNITFTYSGNSQFNSSKTTIINGLIVKTQ